MTAPRVLLQCAAGRDCVRRVRSVVIDRWQRWTRPLCLRSHHWGCSGGADDYPEICDDCWSYVVGPDHLRDDDDDSEKQRAAEMLRILRALPHRKPTKRGKR